MKEIWHGVKNYADDYCHTSQPFIYVHRKNVYLTMKYFGRKQLGWWRWEKEESELFSETRALAFGEAVVYLCNHGQSIVSATELLEAVDS